MHTTFANTYTVDRSRWHPDNFSAPSDTGVCSPVLCGVSSFHIAAFQNTSCRWCPRHHWNSLRSPYQSRRICRSSCVHSEPLRPWSQKILDTTPQTILCHIPQHGILESNKRWQYKCFVLIIIIIIIITLFLKTC